MHEPAGPGIGAGAAVARCSFSVAICPEFEAWGLGPGDSDLTAPRAMLGEPTHLRVFVAMVVAGWQQTTWAAAEGNKQVAICT